PLPTAAGACGAAAFGFWSAVVLGADGAGMLAGGAVGGVVEVGASELAGTLAFAATGCTSAVVVDEHAASTAAVASPHTATRIFFTLSPQLSPGSVPLPLKTRRLRGWLSPDDHSLVARRVRSPPHQNGRVPSSSSL